MKMSEKLNLNSQNNEQEQKELRFPEDPNQYTEAELLADPGKRYHVNPDDFPIFSTQGEDKKTLPIDDTMGRYVQCTADCIAVITGEDNGIRTEEKIPAADHVIYLDKSARPVSWLNNVFWDAFTDKPRPNHSYLAISGTEWFERTSTPINKDNGYIKDASDESDHVAQFSDFKKNNVTNEDIARIRALFIPGGIEDEDIKKIMSTPTGLKGKNITIVDEVSRSGSTLSIAKYLISRAIPEAASVNIYTFWRSGTRLTEKINSENQLFYENQMRSAPVWFAKGNLYGRGIGDINEPYFAKRYELCPNPKTRAQKFGSIVLGEFVDLGKEPGNSSRQLAKEIKLMRKEWDAGHIMMSKPEHYDVEKFIEHLEKQGVQFVRDEEARKSKRAYANIFKEIKNRPVVQPRRQDNKKRVIK